MKKYTKKQVTEFLMESNAIEGVYGPESLKEAQQAWDYAFANRSNITLEYILEIHRLLLQRLAPSWAGKWRDCDVYIGGHRKIFISEALIKEDIKNWNKKCEQDLTGLSRYEMDQKVINLHLDFEEIHPFPDGNGRTGRILMNIMKFNLGLPIWIIHEGNEQMAYYQLFKNR